MPTLEFRLTSITHIGSADSGKEDWTLRSDASHQRTYDRFTVLIGSKEYDGFALSYSVSIKQSTSGNVVWAKKLFDLACEAAGGKLAVATGASPLGTIALWGWTDDSPPHVEIIVLLSDDALFRVQRNLDTHVCRMFLTTDPLEAGLSYADNPDGKDLRWHVDTVEVAIIKSMSLQFGR